MIVRISGTGQFEIDDAEVSRLHEIDADLTAALHAGEEDAFHRHLHEMIQSVLENSTPVPHDRVLPSEVILPPEDVTMEEAKRFFHDEGLLEPLPA